MAELSVISPFPPSAIAPRGTWLTTSPEQAVALEFLEAVATDATKAEELLHEEVIWQSWAEAPQGNVIEGRAEVLDALDSSARWGFVPGHLRLDILSISGSGALVAAEVMYRNLIRDSSGWFEREYCQIFEVENEHIKHIRDYVDTLSLQEALDPSAALKLSLAARRFHEREVTSTSLPTAATAEQQVVVDFFAACVERNLEVIRRLFADDAVFTFWGDFLFSGTFRGKEEVFKNYFEPAGTLTQKGSASWEWRHLFGDSATITAEYIYRNVSVAGAPYEQAYAQIFEVGDGLIQAVRHYCDTQYVLETLLPERRKHPRQS